MKKGLPTAILILSWAIISGLLLNSFSIFSVNNSGILSISLSLFYLIMGSFIFLQLSNLPFSNAFVYLTTSLAFSSLLLNTNLTSYYLLGIFFLCLFPFFLLLFLYSFIQSKNIIYLFKRLSIITLLGCFVVYSMFINQFIHLALLILFTFSSILTLRMIKQEKQLFFDRITFALLRIGVFGTFIPLIFLLTLTIFFTNITNLNLSIITTFLLSFPIMIIFILIHQKILRLPKLLFEFCILMFFYLLSVSVFQFSPIFISSNAASFVQVLLVTSLTFFTIRKWQNLQLKQLQKQQRTLAKEQTELLNQVTYSDFLHNVSELLTTRLFELTQSETFLLFTQKNDEIIILSQKGRPIKEEIMDLLPDFFTTSKIVEINSQLFKALRVRQSDQILWLFFEQNSDSISEIEVSTFIQQYSVITKTVRLLYDAQKQSTMSSLNIDILLQEKLFNSIEREKTKYTNYLHDDVLQTIIALNTLMTQLDGDPEIRALITLEFSKLITSIRNEIFNTTPSTLYHIPFEDNVAILIQDFNQRFPEIHFRLIYHISQQPPEFVIAPVYRIIKELNENSAKHSQGLLVETTLEITQNHLTLTVEDNGIGIGSLEQLEKELIHQKGHIGLLSIKNDINWLSGSFELMPIEKYTSGTSLKITIPLEITEVTDENSFN